VTGSGGFAGHSLCQLLVDRGLKVTGWYRQRIRNRVEAVSYQQVDIRDRASCLRAMTEARPDLVFHLGAMTNPGVCETRAKAAFETNVVGSANVFSAMPPGARAVFASTCHVYGAAETFPTKESEPLMPMGVYAETKVAAEDWIRTSGLPVVIARAFHHTGSTQEPVYALSDWCAQLRQGARRLRVGNIDVRRDYSDVRDIAAGYVSVIEHGTEGEAYNLCSGTAFSLRQFIEWAADGRAVSIEQDPERMRRADIPIFCGDSGRSRALGWSPKFDLQATLRSMAQ
jgi:GDP-4-dehydro-6-deoxy-D-mannose reductase